MMMMGRDSLVVFSRWLSEREQRLVGLVCFALLSGDEVHSIRSAILGSLADFPKTDTYIRKYVGHEVCCFIIGLWDRGLQLYICIFWN